MSSSSALPPPLPPGWSEHTGPNGQVYYYHAFTQESTYVRPLPSFQALPPIQNKKKEKPLVKTAIPGTDWIRVKTTEGNIFYSHKVKKESIWTVPEEIKDVVDELEKTEKQAAAAKIDEEQMMEVERVKSQVREMVKRKADDAGSSEQLSKKPKVDEEAESDDSEEEEEWQREAAAQLAAEAELEQKRKDNEARKAAAEAKRLQEAAKLLVPDNVDLSVEEGKALFKTLLREKDINPLHPWDKCLPLFITDPRYVLLPSVSARREAFDEYCRDRARELRQMNVQKEKEIVDPKADYDRLLATEVKSTRISWSDFRRTWKKDRRFYGWGRDDREREKRFREYLKELGETKKAAAKKAEAGFFALLKEHGAGKDSKEWKDVKRGLVSDPRYDAVGSSSLREELFNVFLKAVTNPVTEAPESSSTSLPKPTESKMDRKERAVREREEQVRAERQRLETDIGKSKSNLNRGEEESDFKTMLTDAIRDPQVTWEGILPQLRTDPRFTNTHLSVNQQMHLFHSHLEHLSSKHINSLHALFESQAPSLATEFSSLPLPTLLASVPAAKLGFDVHALEREFAKWQRERTQAARIAFDEMMSENSFVEFWGRLRNIGGEGVNGGVAAEDMGEDEGEGGGGTVDMKVLAKSVDVREVEKVLQNDKRYIMFAHIPDQRERWIRVSQEGCCSMRFLPSFLFSLLVIGGVSSQDSEAPVVKEKHNYQSDVARLRKIVINSLYSHKEIFLRELISNANDALEKLRLTALTDKLIWDGADPLNITLKVVKNEDGKGDTGIGMSPQELTTNLGTLAKSGTSDFLAQAEGQDGTNAGNLIGAFGLGFYSSFLVADRVDVASIPPPSEKNPNPIQHIFSSDADESSFEVYPDPRGNTLGRGTEITLHLKPDSVEYLDNSELTALVNKHSLFSSTFPIYLLEQRTEEFPDPDQGTDAEPSESASADSSNETPKDEAPKDEDEAIVEDVPSEEEKKEALPVKMRSILVDHWVQLNAQAPIWSRYAIFPLTESSSIEDYTLFYNVFFKDFSKPLTWQHFSADSGTGTAFKAIIYIPPKPEESFWQQPLTRTKDVKLMVKRTFITSDLGDDNLPKWASWVKAVVDADDLPLNVSRETLQSSRFLRQLKNIILKRLLQMFARLAEEEPEKFEELQKSYGTAIKLGAVEDQKHREKLASLARFYTNQRNRTSLDQYLENKKKGQKQIFYLTELGKDPEEISQSVFVEKLHARGYEVLLLNEPMDEIFVQNMRQWKGLKFQDIAKVGLKFGDEDLDEEEEKLQQQELNEKFQPLLEYLKKRAQEVVRDVVLSNRLVASPCAVVADSHGYTANVQKMMNAANQRGGKEYLHEIAQKAKLLEINPRSPLIEGLLRKVEELPEDEAARDPDSVAELEEATSILIDGALIRSGFEVPNTNAFFSRVDRVLRRSLGVSETAPTDTTVKPAPPVDPELPSEVDPEFMPPMSDVPGVQIPDHMKDDVKIEMEEIDEEGNVVVPTHDEL
ncbi:Hsp90 protein-domain-containing protein [Mycena floridula]|nr:Hsp90 protein-domain-containing protein [Mycena floridula]